MEEIYLQKKKRRILNVISDVSELNIVCVLDENNDMKTVYEEAVKKAIASTAVQVSESATAGKTDSYRSKNYMYVL